jgi:hypothetical protein
MRVITLMKSSNKNETKIKSGEMGNLTEERNKPNWTDKLSSISTFIMLIVSIFGICFVIDELNNLKEQNKLLNSSLMQSYRPLGILRHKDSNESNKDLIIISFIPTDLKEKISFVDSLDFVNKGEGVLFFTGFIYYLSDTTIDFRKIFLNSGVYNIRNDEIFPYTRNYPIEPNGKTNIEIFLENIDMRKTYYLYILAFYKDQDQNLYDTQQLTVLCFKEPIKSGEKYVGRFDKNSSGSMHENYHLYKSEEREKLIKRTRELNLPISTYLIDEREHTL